MSREGYITKQNIEEYKQPMQEMAGEEQLQSKQYSEEWIAYQKLQTDSKTLINDKRKSKDDSELMKNVKESLGKITSFYTDNTVPANKNEFEDQLKNLQEMYTNLKDNCQRYLGQRQSIWKNIMKGEGYRRYQMVKEAQTKASVELAILKNRAQLVYNDFVGVTNAEDRPLWVNVLAEARTTHLDLSKKDAGEVEFTGGNCNSVIKLTSKKAKTVAYIKEDSTNIPAVDYTDTYISKLLDSELGKKAKNKGASDKELTDIIKLLSVEFAKKDTDVDQIFWKGLRNTQYSAKDMRDRKVQERLGKTIAWQNADIMNQLGPFLKKSYGYAILGDYAEYYYLHNMSNMIANNNVKMDKGSSITNRNVATSRLAELLGVPELVPASRKVKYKDQNGKNCQGIIMAEAPGDELFATYNQVKDEGYKYMESVFLQINSLEILDVIAGQYDRNNTNIYAESDGKKITNIRAIDNDMSFGKLTYKDIKKLNKEGTYLNTLEDKNGFCKLKAVDQRLYDSLMLLTDEMVNYVFADLLSKDELKALRDRIKGVKDLLKHTHEKDGKFRLCDPNSDNYYAILEDKKTQRKTDSVCYSKTHHLLELSIF